TLIAGKQLDLSAGQLTAADRAILIGASVNIEAGVNSQSSDGQVVARKGYSQLATSNQTLTGGTVQAGTGLTIAATGKDENGAGTGDVTLKGANVGTVTGATTISATRDVTIESLATTNTLQGAS